VDQGKKRNQLDRKPFEKGKKPTKASQTTKNPSKAPQCKTSKEKGPQPWSRLNYPRSTASAEIEPAHRCEGRG